MYVNGVCTIHRLFCDFVVLHNDKSYLENLIPKISEYLERELNLSLHPDKIYVKKFSTGIDFLGWVHFPHHRVLRTSIRKRMFRRLKKNNSNEIMVSYLGLLKHGNTYKLLKKIIEQY